MVQLDIGDCQIHYVLNLDSESWTYVVINGVKTCIELFVTNDIRGTSRDVIRVHNYMDF